jgi:hypothetical protein
MALISPTIVQLSKPASLSFADAMSQHRAWLDAHKIQPASFKPIYVNGVLGFEIGFKTEYEAALFDKQFG